MKYIFLILLVGLNSDVIGQFFFHPDSLNYWKVDTLKIKGEASQYSYSGFLKNGPHSDTIHTQWIVICDTNNRVLSSMFFSPMGRASMNFDYSGLGWGFSILGTPDLIERRINSEPFHNEFTVEEIAHDHKRLLNYKNGLLSSRSIHKFLNDEWKTVEFEMLDSNGVVYFIMKLDDNGNGFSIQYNNGKPSEWVVFENFQELHK